MGDEDNKAPSFGDIGSKGDDLFNNGFSKFKILMQQNLSFMVTVLDDHKPCKATLSLLSFASNFRWKFEWLFKADFTVVINPNSCLTVQVIHHLVSAFASKIDKGQFSSSFRQKASLITNRT